MTASELMPFPGMSRLIGPKTQSREIDIHKLAAKRLKGPRRLINILSSMFPSRVYVRQIYALQVQCDQMTILCIQYLTIFSNEKLPKSIQIEPKWVQNFAQNQINHKYIAKDF